MPRPDGRAADELRVDHLRARLHRVGRRLGARVTFGRTRVLCTASIDEDVPRWMRGTGKGWVTAEYSMLPGSSPERIGPRGGAGQAERPHHGDPAPHRPVAAGGVRHAHAGRAPGHRRLRRAAGRRRHPHRVDLRRLPRAPRRARPASSQSGGIKQAAALGALRRHLRRRRRRRADARPARTSRTPPPRST